MQKCIYLSFEEGYKGFKCYNVKTNKFIISCNVRFNENKFPGMPWNKEDKAFVPISRSYYSPPIPNELPIIPEPNAPPPPLALGGAVPPLPQAGGAPQNPPANPSPPPSPPTPCPHSSCKQHPHDDVDYADDTSPTPSISPRIHDRCKTSSTAGYKGKLKGKGKDNSDSSSSNSPDPIPIPYHAPIPNSPGFRYHKITPPGTFGRNTE
ncbi:hypothetical protein FRB94_013244 [Tulasnella sp. JGI-2019a]|nr:hypothetical protein FRB94_013244 [Tulasnella sp. JGI-2019a]